MARSTSRFSASVAVVGFALLALTPAAPTAVRRCEVVFIHLYRVVDFLVARVRASVHGPRPAVAPALPEAIQDQLRRGLASWDATLRSGNKTHSPKLLSAIARIISIDRTKRRLLVDAGPGRSLEPGDPVSAGEFVVGRVAHAQDGVAVVETPWTPEARFAGSCLSEGAFAGPVRFVMRGLDREEAVAAATNPERREGLRDGALVEVPALDDLLPPTVARLPEKLVLGRLKVDEWLLKASGEVAYLVYPAIDLEMLDAVAIGVPRDRKHPFRDKEFEVHESTTLSCGLLSSWRDGSALIAYDVPVGAAVLTEGRLTGTVEDSLLGAVRVRGIFDPGRSLSVLVIGQDEAFPALVDVIGHAHDRARLRVTRLPQNRRLAKGDLLATAGKGPHIERGLLLGQVIGVDGDVVEVDAPTPERGSPSTVASRDGYPANPWGS